MCRPAAALAAAVIALAAGPAAAQIVSSSMHAQHVAYVCLRAWGGHRESPGRWDARSKSPDRCGHGGRLTGLDRDRIGRRESINPNQDGSA